MSAWRGLQQFAGMVKLPAALLGTCVTGAHLVNRCNPDGYASWYLWSISAGRFQQPLFVGPWVNNKQMTGIVQQALREVPFLEHLTVISGVPFSGKTASVQKECHDQERSGFFVNLRFYSGEKADMKAIEAFVVSRLISNDEGVDHSWFQKLKWSIFPKPKPASVWRGLKTAFEKHPQQLVLVVDDVEVLANKHVQHGGILYTFCTCSAWGPVLLVSSELVVPQLFRNMPSHVRGRTDEVFSGLASAEEVRPHVKELFEEDFGAEGVDEIAECFGGSFKLLRSLDWHRADGIAGVRARHKQELKSNLDLFENGLKSKEKARSTGVAMVTAARLAFGLPVKGLDAFELARAGAAKFETSKSSLTSASWHSKLSGEIMKELVCDSTVRALLKERLPQNLHEKFQQAIRGKCQTALK